MTQEEMRKSILSRVPAATYAELVGVCKRTITNRCQRGEIKHTRARDGRYLIDLSDLDSAPRVRRKRR